MDRESVSKLIDEKLEPIFSKLQKIDEMEKSVSFLSDSYDNLTKRVEAVEANNIDIANENCRLLCDLNANANELNQIKSDLSDLEQYIRQECLEIHGIPLKEDEDTDEIVRKVGDLIDVDVGEKDISVSHRLPTRNPKSNKDQSIIV